MYSYSQFRRGLFVLCMEQPSYFAVIPANVRYAKISANAKLLYGEITALANKEGYCWASNKYFATLYGVKERAIRDWVGQLRDNGFVYVEIENETERRIYVNLGEKSPGGRRKITGGVGEKSPHNNTVNNTTIDKLKLKTSNKVTKDNLSGNSSVGGEYTYSAADITTHPVDDDGNEISRRQRKEKPQHGQSTMRVTNRFYSLVEQHTGVKFPPASKSFFIVQGAAKRHEMNEDDFAELFKYFFADKLTIEQKTSLPLCCSDSYILKWKAWQTNRPITQVEAAEGIRLWVTNAIY